MAGELLIYCIAFFLSIIAVKTDERSAPIISSVISSPANGFFYPGDTLTFTCSATGSPTPRYTWLFNGAVRVQDQVSGVLTVPSASPTDVGNYECQALNQWGTAISSSVVMTLAYINDFTDRSTQQASTLVGASTSLACRSAPASDPPSLYSWGQYASNTDASPVLLTADARRQVDHSTGTLYFANAVLADRASAKPLYACQANIETTIKVGSYWNWAITGTTASPVSPSRAFRNPTSDQVTVLKGQSAPFKCFFYGFPTPTVIWSRSAGAINTSQISEFNTSYTIDSVQESDDGVTITCIPSNSPSTNFAFTLVVDVIPEFNANNTGPAYINGSDGDTVSFHCNAYSKPTSMVTWYINGSALTTPLPPRYVISSDTFNLTISNITNNDTSVVTCKATNIHGSSLAQGGLIVLVRTTITTSPTDQSIPLGQSATFSCGASVDPATPAAFTWLHNGRVVDNSANMSAFCGPTWCDLYIDQVQEIHAGYYQCMVTNDYSEDSSSVAYLDVLPETTLPWSTTTLSATTTTAPSPTYPPIPNPVIMVDMSSELVASSSMSQSCVTNYARQFAQTVNDNLSALKQVILITPSFCPGASDALLNNAYSFMTLQGLEIVMAFGIKVDSIGASTFDAVTGCSHQVGAYLEDFDNWLQPIIRDVANCPRLTFRSTNFTVDDFGWECSSS